MIKSPTNLANVRPSKSRERAAKAAILIANYLKIHTLGASPKKLEEMVLSHYPEWKELHNEAAGELSNQSRLTNDIAWGKNALKDGKYTISIKEACGGGKERLKISEKGKTTVFEKTEDISWEQYFVLIREGKI
jgi:hypothetical protein